MQFELVLRFLYNRVKLNNFSKQSKNPKRGYRTVYYNDGPILIMATQVPKDVVGVFGVQNRSARQRWKDGSVFVKMVFHAATRMRQNNVDSAEITG